MGWGAKIAAGVLGVLLIGSPLWPVAIGCFLYLLFALRPKQKGTASRGGLRQRHVLALILFGLSALALASGGVASPMVFASLGGVVLFWPVVGRLLSMDEVVPAKDSVLLRSRYSPFGWRAVAELKPGPESFPRALSAFTGTLVVLTDPGRVFVLAACTAWSRAAAEEKLTCRLKASLPSRRQGAYLLPLDSGAATEVFRQRFTRLRLPSSDLVKAVSRVSGAVLLDCSGSEVRAAGAFTIAGQAKFATIPCRGGELDSPPLTWEVFEAIERKTRWPEPDSYSSLLESMSASRGEPLGERLKTMAGSEGVMSLESLGGVQVQVTRSQLRAIVALYS